MLKKTLPTLACALILSNLAHAQEKTVGFEDLTLQSNSNYLMFNDETLNDGATIIISYDEEEEININLHGDIEYGFLAGFDVSNVTDPSYINYSLPLAAQPFSGANATDNYAIAFVNVDFMGPDPTATIPVEVTFENIPDNYFLDHLFIANGAIAYNYIQDYYPGQNFYFDLIIKGYNENELIDSVIVHLADFRNGASHVIEDWEKIDLTDLATATQLTFDLRSNDDEGGYGINTPAYFALDEITFKSTISVDELQAKSLKIYPNPTQGLLHFSDEVYELTLMNSIGQSILHKASVQEVDMTHLPTGIYYLNFKLSNGKEVTQKIIKK